MSESTDQRFPHLARWVKVHGYVEIGYDDYSRSFIRALDIGGMFWEGASIYPTLDDALSALNEGCAQMLRELFGKPE